MNKEEFIDNFSIDLTNSTVAERKKYAEKIYNKINDLQQQVFNKTLAFEGIEKKYEELILINKTNAKVYEKLLSKVKKYEQIHSEIKKICQREKENNRYTIASVFTRIENIIKEDVI